jgi:uncharacterized protein (DUF885 family)
LLWDNATVEGWGLYAEGLFWEHGGLGPSKRAQINILRSYQFRIRRVIYDVHVATGRWTLQEAADWKEGTEGAEVSRDILRAIQWPTQLIGYFAGKAQIDALREEVRAQLGEAYSDRDFHDRFLAAGLVPIPLIRAKMLGTPVPRP